MGPLSDAPQCTVVICTRNRPVALRRCLEGIRNQSQAASDLIVLNNGTLDPAIEEIAATFDARYAIEPLVGLSRARNLGLELSQSELVAFIDDDAVPDREWLRNLTREFVDPNLGFATCRIVDRLTDGRGEVIDLVRGGDQPIILDRNSPGWFASANFGWIGDGTGFVVRKQALQDAGGFCIELGRGMLLDDSEEHHAFYSIIGAGFSGTYVPDAILYHLPAPTTPENATRRILKDVSNLFAYTTKLLVEDPASRRELLSYLFRKRDSNRRPLPLRNLKKSVPRWRLWLAALSGPLVYLRSRRWRREAPPSVSKSASPDRGTVEKHTQKASSMRST